MTIQTHFSLYDELMKNYSHELDGDGVRGKRIAERLDALSKIGFTDDNGSNRPGFSREEKQGKELVMMWMKEAGLQVHMDGAGNVIGRLE
ncbi:MAG TPA: Zn-dependent hydrolase, partial [Bacillota bacterium]|nr:Zn-dependent hydrolase [Bacillota bacterium]